MATYKITLPKFISYQRVAQRLRGATGKPYTNKIQYSIDRNKSELDRFTKTIQEEILDNRIKHATVDGDGNLIEKESGTDQQGEQITRFQYTVKARQALEAGNSVIEMTEKEIKVYYAPEETEWEKLVNFAEYEALKGILFPESREYDLDKVLPETPATPVSPVDAPEMKVVKKEEAADATDALKEEGA